MAMSDLKKALIVTFIYTVFLILNVMFVVYFAKWGLQAVKIHSSNDKLFVIWGVSLVGMITWYLLILPLGEKIARDGTF